MQYAGPILVADDDADFAILVQEALHEAGVFHTVVTVSNGLEAVEFLKGEGAHAHPALVMLDLKLPIKHGFDVLRWIRRQPDFKEMPVVVLSGCGFETEAHTARELGADVYMVKPCQFQSLVEVVEKLRDRFITPAHTYA